MKLFIKKPGPAKVLTVKPIANTRTGPMILKKPAQPDKSLRPAMSAAHPHLVNPDVPLNELRQIVVKLLNEHGPAAKLRIISTDPQAYLMIVHPIPKV